MSKSNYFFKTLKRTSLFINSLLKKYLNKLKLTNLKNIKNQFLTINRVFLTLVILTILSFSYLFIPYSYNKNELQIALKNQLSEKFAINFIFSKNVNYNLFPRPHFILEDSSIIEKEVMLSEIKRLKIFISLKNFFSLKNITIEKIILENSNFNVTKKNINFFTNILDNNLLEHDILIKDSNIFFRNSEDVLLFVNKIKQIKYYYNPKTSLNILKAHNEIFNIPYSVELQNDKRNKKLFLRINSKVIKLKIENELEYSNNVKIGLLNNFNGNKKNITSYKLRKNTLNFLSLRREFNKDISYRGLVNFKPFFLNTDVDTGKLNLTYLFDSESFLVDLLKTEILDNKNLNIKIDINSKKIFRQNYFVDSLLKFKIDQGAININNSKINWSNHANFKISDSLFFIDNGNVFLRGKVTININDLDEIYKFLQTPKKFRKVIRKLEFNFNYNMDYERINFHQVKINDENKDIFDSFFNKSTTKEKLFQNQIYFKKFLNKIFQLYEG